MNLGNLFSKRTYKENNKALSILISVFKVLEEVFFKLNEVPARWMRLKGHTANFTYIAFFVGRRCISNNPKRF